jgi:hypothetical protein
MKNIFSGLALFVFLFSTKNLLGQDCFLEITNRAEYRTTLIYEHANVIIDLHNKLELKGKLNIVNDTMLNVDDTTFSIFDLDYIGTREYFKPNKAAAYGTMCCLGGMGGILAVILADKALTPIRFFDFKHRECYLRISCDGNHNNNLRLFKY